MWRIASSLFQHFCTDSTETYLFLTPLMELPINSHVTIKCCKGLVKCGVITNLLLSERPITGRDGQRVVFLHLERRQDFEEGGFNSLCEETTLKTP